MDNCMLKPNYTMESIFESPRAWKREIMLKEVNSVYPEKW